MNYTNRIARHIASNTIVGLVLCLGIGGSSVLATAQNKILAFSDNQRTMICLNTFQPFGYGNSIGSFGSAVYAPNAFENGGLDTAVLPNSRLNLIQSSGFDCLRMVIDVGPLMSARTEGQLDSLVDQIREGIVRRLANGLRVILDIHPLPLGVHPVPGYADVDLVDGPHGPNFQRLIYVVRKLAVSVRDHFTPYEVAIELFNEPPSPESFRNRKPWNEQIEYYWKQIRLILPNHTLIVAGTGFAGLDGLISGDPSAGVINLRPEYFDANTGYAIHPYESATFTHQGYPGFFAHVSGLNFPAGDDKSIESAKQTFRTGVINDQALSLSEKMRVIVDFLYRTSHSYSFESYKALFGDEKLLLKRLDVVTTWADRHQLSRRQIMNTEFGVNHDQHGCSGKASATSAFNFVRAIRDISNTNKLGLITIHHLQGDCFAISSSSSPHEFDPSILDALGLQRRP